jgi:acyl-CoA thioester hydrolase
MGHSLYGILPLTNIFLRRDAAETMIIHYLLAAIEPMKPHPLRLELNSYPHRFDIVARFADIDLQRHLNNARIAEFYQEGRVSFHRWLKDEFNLEREFEQRTLVAHQSMDYLGEAAYPGTVTMGVGVLRVGSTSYTLGLSMHQHGKCVGLSATVLVQANKEGPVPLSARWREILQSKLLPEAARL